MCCEEYLPLLNELLNKTLAPGDKRGLEAHLAVCEGCRAEFQRLKKADDLLREIVSGMFSEIEVPPELSCRIGKALEGQRQKPVRPAHLGWLPALLRTSAVAAALLLFIAAGTFGYRYIFSPPWKQSEVVWQEPAAGGEQKSMVSSDDAGPEAGSETGSGPGPETSGAKDVRPESAPVIPREPAPSSEPGKNLNLQPESGIERLSQESAPPGPGGPPEPDPEPEVTGRQRGGANIPGDAGSAADSAPPEGALPAESPGQEEKLLFAAGAPPAVAENGEIPDAKEKEGDFARDHQENATKELGLAYLKPGYLPPGAEFQDVTRISGTIYQNYRVGRFSMQIRQSPAVSSGITTGPASRKTGEIEINGARAILTETEAGAENGTSNRLITITWQQDGLLLSVGGELPLGELVKVASSLE